MLAWNLYFLVKFGLHLAGQLQLSALWNIALFAALALTNPAVYENKRLMSLLRYLVFSIPALALFLHESGLVVSWVLVDQIRLLFGFSTEYVTELLRRIIQPWMLWGTLLALVLMRVLDRYFRISTWVALGLVTFWGTQTWNRLSEAGSEASDPVAQVVGVKARANLSPAEMLALGPADFQKLQVARDKESNTRLRDNTVFEGAGPGEVLEGFFERQRNLAHSVFAPTTSPDFDVIVLQICSMSWADLQYARQSQHPVIRQADFVFENFNSATSYSGPAAIRLLRGKCGQTRHDSLYSPADSNCMLFEQLRKVGFDLEIGLNHDGRFQDFSRLVKTNIGSTATQRVAHNEVRRAASAFDGSQVGRDGDYLRTWWTRRLQQDGPPVAFYYNSITLHDGNRLPNSQMDSITSYPIRLERLLNDIELTLGEIRRSNRKAFVMVVPEHGAGLTGEYGQLPGLRELPTPAITRVPVFGYWIAPGYKANTQAPVTLKQSVSYSALGELLARWLAQPAEQQLQPAWPVLLSDLPYTRLVSEQGNITVMENRDTYWMKAPGSNWKALGPVQALPAAP